VVVKIELTLSKLFALISLFLGSVLSYVLQDSAYFTNAMTFAGLVFISKNAEQAWKK
jgi:ABC-type Mn2+/Zn2+ transport system permease subunit